MTSPQHQPWATQAVGHMRHPLFGNVWIKDTNGLDFKQPDLNGKYCNKLYTWLEVDMHGRCWMCCPSWLPYPIGNILENSIEEIWNGEKAQELRKQVFTGKWDYCQTTFCPMIQGDHLNNVSDILQGKEYVLPHEKQALISKSLISEQLPTYINFSNDESCNLKCPSCRTTKLLYTEGPLYDKRKKINDKLVETFLTTPTDRKFGILLLVAEIHGQVKYIETCYIILMVVISPILPLICKLME